MSIKRYIATDLPSQSWYSELSPKFKALWIHLLLTCDCAGSFEVAPKLFTAYIGETITERDVFTAFGNRVVAWRDKGLIPAFVRNQYYSKATQRLSPSCKPHGYVLARLAELGLTEAMLDEMASRPVQHELPLVEAILAQPETQPAAQPAEKPRRLVIPPKVEWVREYCESRRNGVDAQRFCDFYQGKGWKVGREKMKDWEAAVRTWEGRERDAHSPATQTAFTDPNYQGRGGF